MTKYTQEELRKLYEALPKDLKDAIVSEDTAETIRKICQRNQIADADIPRFARMVGDVLMGLLPPQDFESFLGTELGLAVGIAKRVAQETTRFIFYPVKESLASFYKISLVPGGRIVSGMPQAPEPAKKKAKVSDTYREQVK